VSKPSRRKADSSGPELFIERTGQLRITDKSAEQQALEKGRVECLGMTFKSDEERRAHFLEKLREKLKDPEFRKIEGFPIGKDEDILALSDPPYYTACPNPFLEAFVDHYGKPYDGKHDTYKREPFAVDVDEGRTDIVYTSHSYHTKVPPRAIMHYISHYTEPGGLVLDFFAGSGMCGVAARMCALGSRGTIEDEKARVPILIDLSPAATSIASGYLWPSAPDVLYENGRLLLDRASSALEIEYRLPSTLSLDKQDEVEFVISVEAFVCPVCQGPVISKQVVQATKEIGTAVDFPCPNCSALVSRAPSPGSQAHRLERRLHTVYDDALKSTRQELNRVPILAQVRGPRLGRRLIALGDRSRFGSAAQNRISAPNRNERCSVESEDWIDMHDVRRVAPPKINLR